MNEEKREALDISNILIMMTWTHPTVQGAKALYGRVLTDFPEIMVSN